MKSVLIFLLALFTTCKETPSQAISQIELNVGVTPKLASPANPAIITAAIPNYGTTTSYRNEGCSYWGPGLFLAMLDPDSNILFLSNPQLRLMCLYNTVPFLPGEKFSVTSQFNGTLFNSSGKQFPAQNGTYTAVVSFWVSQDKNFGGGRLIEQRVSFQWVSE